MVGQQKTTVGPGGQPPDEGRRLETARGIGQLVDDEFTRDARDPKCPA
jgi:hypothetical protein